MPRKNARPAAKKRAAKMKARMTDPNHQRSIRPMAMDTEGVRGMNALMSALNIKLKRIFGIEGF